MQTSLEPNSLFPILSVEENIQRRNKIFLLTAQFHVPGTTQEQIAEREQLHTLLAGKKISGEEIEKKVIYLTFISNLTYLILSQFNTINPFNKPTSKEDLLALSEKWFKEKFPNYAAKTLSNICDVDMAAYVQHNSEHLKLAFETLLRNFWKTALELIRKKSSDPVKIFDEMQRVFKLCSNLPDARPYVFNLLSSQLMQLFYQSKQEIVSDIDIEDTHNVLKQKVKEKIEAREPERIVTGAALEVDAILPEVLIFDMPRRKTVFDELRQDWAARNKASAPLDQYGIFTADPNAKF